MGVPFAQVKVPHEVPGPFIGYWVSSVFGVSAGALRTPLIVRTLSLCMVRPGKSRFRVGLWVGFWVVGLRAWDFPTESDRESALPDPF